MLKNATFEIIKIFKILQSSVDIKQFVNLKKNYYSQQLNKSCLRNKISLLKMVFNTLLVLIKTFFFWFKFNMYTIFKVGKLIILFHNRMLCLKKNEKNKIF